MRRSVDRKRMAEPDEDRPVPSENCKLQTPSRMLRALVDALDERKMCCDSAAEELHRCNY